MLMSIAHGGHQTFEKLLFIFFINILKSAIGKTLACSVMANRSTPYTPYPRYSTPTLLGRLHFSYTFAYTFMYR